jgi:hypothetical protein
VRYSGDYSVLHRYKILPSGEVVSGEASVIQSQHYALGGVDG